MKPAARIPGNCRPLEAGGRAQTGAALFIGLIMLLVIALIGVSGIRTVVLEKNMAMNSQFQILVFQAADSAIEGSLADDAAFVDAINVPPGAADITRTYPVDHTGYQFNLTSSSTIVSGTPSIPVGFTIGDFIDYPFTITGTGNVASINASDTHIQTATRTAPYFY